MPHLKPELLVQLAESPARDAPPHLLGCSGCAAELDSLTRLLSTMRQDHSVDPRPDVVARAYDLYTAAARPTLGERLRRFTAALVTDSATLAPALAGVRGAPGSMRQLLYSTETVDVDLAFALGEAPATVRGQALAKPVAAAELTAYRAVALYREDVPQPLLSTATDALGCFSLADVTPGRYRLLIELDEGALEVGFALAANPVGPSA